MVTTNFAKNRNSLHYALNPKIHFFGKSPADLLAFGHFKNVHFRFSGLRLFQISSFSSFSQTYVELCKITYDVVDYFLDFNVSCFFLSLYTFLIVFFLVFFRVFFPPFFND